ncbi:MAG: hypothetical protein ACI4JG_10015 [Acutalibacteraceae bacterium]
MKNIKKTVSFLLSICLIFSCFAIGLTALAAEDTDAVSAAVEAAEAMIADKTSISTKAPTDEAKLAAYNAKLELYEKAIAAYKALTVEQKDAFDISLTLNILKAFSEREGFLIKDEFDSKLPEGSTWKDQMPLADARAQANETLDERLGEHPARTAALEMGNKYLGTAVALYDGKSQKLSANSDFVKYPELKALAVEYINAYKSAPQLVRMMLDGYSAAFLSFSSNSIGATYRDIIKMSGKAQLADNPFTEQAPESAGTKPKDSNYAGGANDPEYIADLQAYLAKKEVVMQYNQRKALYEYNMYISAMQEFSESTPENRTASQVVLKLLEGYIAFDKTGSTEKAKEGMAAYDAMTDAYDVAVFKSIGSTYVYYTYYLNSKKDDYAYSNLSASSLYKKCEETAGMEIVAAFEEWIAEINLDEVNNDTVAQAQAKYKEVPASLKSKISAEASEKYAEIIKRYDPVDPLTPSDYKFEEEINAFTPANVGLADFPVIREFNTVKIAVENKLLTGIYGLAVEKLLGSDTLLTNKNISVVFSLYDMLVQANIVSSGINVSRVLADEFTPAKAAAFLDEEKFAGAKAKLLAAAETNNTTTAYADIVFENGDWGFSDGDANGFALAAAAALRAITDILHNGVLVISNVIYLPNSIAENGDYVYGAYEELIPLLEGIGLKGVISSQEYTERFHAAVKGNKYDYLDALMLPVLQPVTTLITDLEKDTLFTLLDILPNVARAIDTGLLTERLNAFLDKSSLLSGTDVDLSADAINAMIAGQKISLALSDRATVSFTLRAIDWNKLSRCGSLEAVPSVSAANAYRPAVKSSRVKTRALLGGYITDAVFSIKLSVNSTNSFKLSPLF